MLNSIGLYNHLAGNQASGLAASEQIQAADSKPAKQSVAKISGENLSLSSRAQKLNAINNEFFNGKAIASVDTAKLIDRVYEYGLISKGEYGQLTRAPQDSEGQPIDTPTSTQSLTQFLDHFEQRLEKVEGYQDSDQQSVIDLKSALASAKGILGDVEGAKGNPQFKNTLDTTKSVLNDLLGQEAFADMPLEDRVDMSNVIKTLDIVDKIDPKRLDNQRVNHYIAVANF